MVEPANPHALTGLDGRLLVIYDGYCGFCNGWVRWFLKRDRHDRLRFAPSESPVVAELLARHGFGELAPSTIFVAEAAGSSGERLLTRSNAVIAIFRELSGGWPLAARMLRLIPRVLRDFGYDRIAAVRYRIAGRYSSCPVPTAEERGHFL
jgi:predicted DCC family thiol-disulfide oxidoreductase YuxK